MNAKPKFLVVRGVPYFNNFDAIQGWSFRVIAHTMTQGFAHVIQAREDGDGMDETVVEVRDMATGRCVHRRFPDFDGELYA